MALFREPANVRPVEDGQVLISLVDNPQIGKNGLFGPEWHTVGILTKDGNVGLTRTVEETNAEGAGLGVVAYSFNPGAVESKFEVLEDNAVTRWIQWPDRVTKAGVDIKLHSAKVAQAYVAVVRVFQDQTVQIEVSRYKAFLTMPESGRGFEVAGREVSVKFRPGPDKDIFEERRFKFEEGALVELEPKIFVDDAKVKAAAKTGPTYQAGGLKPAEVEAAEDLAKPATGAAPAPGPGGVGA